jgi:hypothetical protein
MSYLTRKQNDSVVDRSYHMVHHFNLPNKKSLLSPLTYAEKEKKIDVIKAIANAIPPPLPLLIQPEEIVIEHLNCGSNIPLLYIFNSGQSRNLKAPRNHQNRKQLK